MTHLSAWQSADWWLYQPLAKHRYGKQWREENDVTGTWNRSTAQHITPPNLLFVLSSHLHMCVSYEINSIYKLVWFTVDLDFGRIGEYQRVDAFGSASLLMRPIDHRVNRQLWCLFNTFSAKLIVFDYRFLLSFPLSTSFMQLRRGVKKRNIFAESRFFQSFQED